MRAQRHNNVCTLLQRAGFNCLCAHCDANAVDIGEECRHFDLALCVAAYNVLGVGREGATESVQTVCMLRALGVFTACCVSESVKERCCKLTNFVHKQKPRAETEVETEVETESRNRERLLCQMLCRWLCW